MSYQMIKAIIADKTKSASLRERIKLEVRIVKKVIDAVLAAGHAISVYDGEEWAIKRSTNKSDILNACFSTDDDQFRIRDKEGNYVGWIHFVYGNDGHDVISDYSTDIEELLKPINDYADQQALAA